MIPLDAGDRRTLIVGTLVVAMIVLFGRGLPRLRSWESSRLAAADAAERALDHGRRVLTLDSLLRSGVPLADSTQTVYERAHFLGATPTEAAVGVVQLVEREAATAKVRIASSTVHVDSVFGADYALVSVRIIASADITGLLSWLRVIEGGQMLLRVREISVTQPDPGANDRTPESLNVNLLVEGLAILGATRGGGHP